MKDVRLDNLTIVVNISLLTGILQSQLSEEILDNGNLQLFLFLHHSKNLFFFHAGHNQLFLKPLIFYTHSLKGCQQPRPRDNIFQAT